MKIFIDSSVIFAALLSPEGGSTMVIKLCEAGSAKGIISRDVAEEATQIIRRKTPGVETIWKKVLHASGLSLISKIPASFFNDAKKCISYEKDAKILAGAKYGKVDYLITLDIRHFIKDSSVSKKSGVAILTPGEFLKMLVRISN